MARVFLVRDSAGNLRVDDAPRISYELWSAMSEADRIYVWEKYFLDRDAASLPREEEPFGILEMENPAAIDAATWNRTNVQNRIHVWKKYFD